MATAIIMPRQGNTVESCLLVEWKKDIGDTISKGDIICEVETDKAMFEVEASESGILLDLFFNEGDDIPVLTTIAVIGYKGENYDDLRPSIASENEELEESKPAEVKEERIEPTQYKQGKDEGNAGVSPRAKRLAAKKGINPQSITGSGPMGRVIERDIIKAADASQPLTPAAIEASLSGSVSVPVEGSGIGGRIIAQDVFSSSKKTITEDVVKEESIKGVRKIISKKMLESLQNSAQLTLNSSADAAALLSLRETFKNSKLDSQFTKVNINDLLMYAVIKVLPKNPVINSLLQDDKVKYYENIHFGFAVDTARGLMVPTIKNSQNYNLLGLSNEIKRLANACHENKIQVEELSGATFTVTNLGNFGIEHFTPVLNLPQTAILGVSQINLKPIQSGDEVKFIPHIGLSLTINHQVIDGAAGARFLQDISLAIKEINLLIAI